MLRDAGRTLAQNAWSATACARAGDVRRPPDEVGIVVQLGGTTLIDVGRASMPVTAERTMLA